MARSKQPEPCFRVRPLDEQEHQALRAVANGDGDEYQQRLVLKLIINEFSRAHDLLYVPGSFDQSAFMNGRAFVGQQVLKYLNIPIGKLKELEDNNDEQ